VSFFGVVFPSHTHKGSGGIARLSTCKSCGKKITFEEKRIYSNKTYCESCYNIQLQHRESYNNLISDICIYFNIEQPTGLILKQIKQYKEEFKYSYDAMRYVLWYIKEILNKEFIIQYGIALIKYHYYDAEAYYNQQENIKKSTENINDGITVKVVKFNYQKPKQTKCLVDIEDLIKGGVDN